MGEQVRITRQTRILLAEMLRDPTGEHYGFELSKATGLRPSTLYPTFARLEQAGWIAGQWEVIDPDRTRRPPRRYYRLTADGMRWALEALDDAPNDGDLPGIVGA